MSLFSGMSIKHHSGQRVCDALPEDARDSASEVDAAGGTKSLPPSESQQSRQYRASDSVDNVGVTSGAANSAFSFLFSSRAATGGVYPGGPSEERIPLSTPDVMGTSCYRASHESATSTRPQSSDGRSVQIDSTVGGCNNTFLQYVGEMQQDVAVSTHTRWKSAETVHSANKQYVLENVVNREGRVEEEKSCDTNSKRYYHNEIPDDVSLPKLAKKPEHLIVTDPGTRLSAPTQCHPSMGGANVPNPCGDSCISPSKDNSQCRNREGGIVGTSDMPPTFLTSASSAVSMHSTEDSKDSSVGAVESSRFGFVSSRRVNRVSSSPTSDFSIAAKPRCSGDSTRVGREGVVIMWDTARECDTDRQSRDAEGARVPDGDTPEAMEGWYYVCRSDALRQQRELAAQLLAEVKREVDLNERVTRLRDELHRRQQQQEEFIRIEDFSAAAAVDDALAELKEKLGDLDTGIVDAQQAQSDLLGKSSSTTASFLKGIRLLEERVRSRRSELLSEFEEEQHQLECYCEEEEQRLAAEMDAVEQQFKLQARQADSARMNARQVEERQLFVAAEESQRLSAMHTERKKLLKQISDAQLRLAALDDEERLRREEIQAITVELALDRDSLSEQRRLYEEHREKLERWKQQVAEEIELLEVRKDAAEETKKKNEECVERLSWLSSFLSIRESFVASLVGIRTACSSVVRESLHNVLGNRLVLQQLREKEQRLQQQQHSLQQERMAMCAEQQRLESLLPLLQQEKQLSVQARDFKAAASFSTQINDCTSELEGLRAKSVELEEQKERGLKELEALEPELEAQQCLQETSQRHQLEQKRETLIRLVRQSRSLIGQCPEDRDDIFGVNLREEVALYQRQLESLGVDTRVFDDVEDDAATINQANDVCEASPSDDGSSGQSQEDG